MLVAHPPSHMDKVRMSLLQKEAKRRVSAEEAKLSQE
jgi:hypothetical protein